MRQIGSIDGKQNAERFADYLRSCGISCTVDGGTDGFRIWIHEEDHVAAAKAEMLNFFSDPNQERYRDSKRRAMARVEEDAARLRASRKHTVDLSEKWDRPAVEQCPTTFLLIGLSFAVAFFVGFMPHGNMLRGNDFLLDRLWFTNDGSLNPILHGEFWRLITPIFLHGNLMHIVFNMMMTYQLGMLIETRLGTPKFIGMVLTIAAFSNFAEFWFHTPFFGGMSGVIYGLFGYCWIKGRLEPESGFALQPQAVTMMLVWFVLCLTPAIPNVANWAHGVGLATGMSMAFIGTLIKPLMKWK